jgi:hypothetical protein
MCTPRQLTSHHEGETQIWPMGLEEKSGRNLNDAIATSWGMELEYLFLRKPVSRGTMM